MLNDKYKKDFDRLFDFYWEWNGSKQVRTDAILLLTFLDVRYAKRYLRWILITLCGMGVLGVIALAHFW